MTRKLSSGKCDSTATDVKRLFDRKLLAYAAAAGAAVVSAQAAQAIVSVKQLNVDVVNGSYSLDVDGNGSTPDFIFTNTFSYPDGSSGVSGAAAGDEVVGHFVPAPGGSSFKASRLVHSHSVSPADSFNTPGTLAFKTPIGTYGDWNGQSGFLGIRFEGNDSAEHFGFVQMSVGNNPFAIHLDAVAWQTLPADTLGGEGNIHIHNIAAPEPVGLGVLALGAAGLASLRRRRSA